MNPHDDDAWPQGATVTKLPRSTNEQVEVAAIAKCKREDVAEYIYRPHFVEPSTRARIVAALETWTKQGRLLP